MKECFKKAVKKALGLTLLLCGLATTVSSMDSKDDTIQPKKVSHLPLIKSFPKDRDVMDKLYQVIETPDGFFHPFKETDGIMVERDENILRFSFIFDKKKFTASFNDTYASGQRERLVPIHIKNRYFTQHFYTDAYPSEVVTLDSGLFKGIYNHELSVTMDIHAGL